MNERSNTLTGKFIDAVVHDQQRAVALLADHPDLLNARWLWGETVLHFLAVERFASGVKFLAERGAMSMPLIRAEILRLFRSSH